MLSQRVSAGSSFYEGKFILAVLGLIVFAGLLAGSFAWLWSGMWFYAVGLAASCVGLVAAYMSIARRRVWVVADDQHFMYEDATRAREVRYADVRALTAVLQTNYREGMPDSVTVRCTVWIEDGGAPVALPMVRNVKSNADDPVIAVMRRSQAQVQAASKEAFDRGVPVEGEGWRLTKLDFETVQAGARVTLRLDEISAVEEIDGNICVWRSGQDDPATRVPVGAKNAFMLAPLLSAAISGKKKEETTAPPADGLGRVLFERKSSAWGWVAAGIGLIVVAVAVYQDSAVWSVLCGLGAIGMFALYWTRRNPLFRCCEWGVSWRQGTSENRIRYTEISEFTYSATRHYHNGAYTGTVYTFKFVPLPETHAKTINYQCTIQQTDDAMENLRQHISGVIAGRMARELREGKTVRWTANMRFVPEGLEVRPSALIFGRKEPRVLGLHEIGELAIEKGVLKIYLRGESKPVMDEQVSAANFFPGLSLLQYLQQQLNQSAGKA